jgi:hypothetical protein
MPSPPPNPDNGYELPSDMTSSKANWQPIFPSSHDRLAAREALEATFQNLINLGVSQAIAAVQNEIAPTAAQAQAYAQQIETLLNNLLLAGVPADLVAETLAKRFTNDTELAAKAPLNSPGFTGTPTAPTAASGTDTQQLANAAFVAAATDALAETMLTALGNRVRIDAAQTITTAEKAQVARNIRPSVATKTAAFTVGADDIGATFRCSGSWTMELGAAATLGENFVIYVKNIGAGIIAIDPSSAELIDGRATFDLLPGQSGAIVCDGYSAFDVIGAPTEISTFISAASQADLIIPLPNGYKSHEITIHKMLPASAAQLHMQASDNGGVGYLNASNDYAWQVIPATSTPTPSYAGSDYGDTKIILSGTQKAVTSAMIGGVIKVLNPLETDANKTLLFWLRYRQNSDGIIQYLHGEAEIPTLSRLTHLRLFFPSVNIETGKVTLRSIV